MGEEHAAPTQVTPTEHELRLREKELELIHDLAQTGLKGTLIGAIAVMVMAVTIYGIAVFSGDKSISGWHILGIIGVATLAVVAYGSYVFRRAVTMTAKIRGAEAGLKAGHDRGEQ